MASNILVAQVDIEGIRPLLWHRFGPDSIPLEKQEKTGVAGNDPEEWKKTVLRTKDGQLYLEPSYIFGTIRDGAKHTKKGRGSIQALVTATLQIMDDRILVDRWLLPEEVPSEDPDDPVYLDIRSVRNPNSKGRNVRYRIAASPGWKTSFSIMWDRTIVSRAEIQACVNDAGRLCGVGDGRTIGMGRFNVTSFTITEGE